MHQYLLNAINAIINNKFAEARQWLNQLISSDTSSTSPGDIAIAHYLYSYICHLEKDKSLALQHYQFIDTTLIPDKTLLLFLIDPQKSEAARKISDSTMPCIQASSAQVSNSPTASSSPQFTNPRSKAKEIIVGFDTNRSQQTDSPRSASSSYRCIEALQKTYESNKIIVSNEQVEKFKQCHDFWKYLLHTYLIQLGVPEKSKEKDKPTLEKIFTIAGECKIPFYFLCQNLASLSKFWRINDHTSTEAEDDQELKPLVTPLVIGIEPKTTEVITPQPKEKGGLARLLAATAKQSPINNINVATLNSTQQLHSSSLSCSSSSSTNSKLSALSNNASNTLITPIRTDTRDNPSLKPGATPTPQIPITSPPIAIKTPSADDAQPENTYGVTYIPNATHIAQTELFLLEEELATRTAGLDNLSEQKKGSPANHVLSLPTVPINHTPRSIHKRPSLLATRTPTSENDEPVTKTNTDSPSAIPVTEKNKIKLKKCMIENNCLATLMLLLSGVRDSADRFEHIPLVPNPTALEIAAFYGHVHCLTLIANTNIEVNLYDRALRLALKHAHIACIQLLLEHVSFNEKVNMYFAIESSPNQNFQKLRQLLLDSHLTLYKALQHNSKILIQELACNNLSETAEEKNGIIIRAAELGYDCCLTESRLKGADITYINLALINAAKNNHILCLEILLRLNIDTKIKINALISLMRNIKDYCNANLPEPNWVQYFLSDKSFILFLSALTPSDIQTAFIDIAKVNESLFVNVLLKTDKLSLVQLSQPDNPLYARALLKLDKSALAEIASSNPAALTAIQNLDDPNNITKIIEIYNLIKSNKVTVLKRDKLIEISQMTKTTVFNDAIRYNHIDIMLAFFNTGVDVNLEKTAINKIIASNNLSHRAKLIEYALNNPFTLALLLRHNLPSKTAPGILHKVTTYANLDCLQLLLDNGFDIDRIDEISIKKKISINSEANVGKNTFTNPCSPINNHSENSTKSLFSNTTSATTEKIFIISTGTIAMLAVYLKRIDCLEFLLKRGTGVNDPRKPANLSLQLPANCHYKYQQLMIATDPSNPSAQNNIMNKSAEEIDTSFSGYSVFHFAVNHSYPDFLQLLLESQLFKKEMLALKTTEGDTVLHTAATKNKYKCIALLLNAGADLFAVNNRGEIPLVTAIRVVAKETYEAFIENKKFLDNNPAPIKLLKEMFEAALKSNNTAQLSLIIDCLFSSKINWCNQVEIPELFQNFVHIVIRYGNFAALQAFKLYFNKYYKLEFAEKDISIEFLGESYIALNQYQKFLDEIKFAINKNNWEIAKFLVEHISSTQHIKAASHLDNKEAVTFILKLKQLDELIPKKETTISLNLNP